MKILEILTEKRQIGTIGEIAAVKHLKKNRYKILRKNYVALEYEIDIIAENKDAIVFVEVKTRTIGKQNDNEPRPASAVTPEKQRKIISTAKFFIGTRRTAKKLRFDIIEVYLDDKRTVQSLCHIESAFNYNTAHPNRFNN